MIQIQVRKIYYSITLRFASFIISWTIPLSSKLREACILTKNWTNHDLNAFFLDGPLRTFCLQIKVVSMHQNGRDTHIRQIKIFGPRGAPHSQLGDHSTSDFRTVSMLQFAGLRWYDDVSFIAYNIFNRVIVCSNTRNSPEFIKGSRNTVQQNCIWEKLSAREDYGTIVWAFLKCLLATVIIFK